MAKHGAVYFAAVGGAAALISQSILAAEVIAYPELGAEAVRRLRVNELPVIVANDVHGGDIYERGRARYRRVD
jgi:fumarate hydratase subunit beta